MNPGRGLVAERLGENRFRGYAVPLEQHTRAVRLLVEKAFRLQTLENAVLATAAELHGKYKPARMRVEEIEGKLQVGFRGHPYLLGFTDFEEVFGSSDKERIAIATGIARLHHFLNIRDVDTFIHTLGLVKAYLSQNSVYMRLKDIRARILEGVALLHVADMVAGYIEQLLLARAKGSDEDVSIIDTESLSHVEPHIPVGVRASFEGSVMHAQVILHGLEQAVNPKLFESSVTLTLHYDVYEGVFEGGGFTSNGKQGYGVSILITHKRNLLPR